MQCCSHVAAPPHYQPPTAPNGARFRPGPWIADHSGAGRIACWSVRERVRIRLLCVAVLSVRARRGGGLSHGNGFVNAWAGVCGRVQDVDDGTGAAERADPGGRLLALVVLRIDDEIDGRNACLYVRERMH